MSEIVKISALHKELLKLVSSLPTFQRVGFSIYDLDDMVRQMELQNMPAVGVGFNASFPIGKHGAPMDFQSAAAAMVVHQFSVVIAIEYQYAGQEDFKGVATDLLDEIRTKVLGYRGVNSRPWLWVRDMAESGASIDGIVLYSQVWHTATPVGGSFNS